MMSVRGRGGGGLVRRLEQVRRKDRGKGELEKGRGRDGGNIGGGGREVTKISLQG